MTDLKQYDLLKWKEFGQADAPSIKILFATNPYPNQEVIAKYLENGEVSIVAASYEKDAFTGEIIYPARSRRIMSDDEFSWDGSLPYYVRKYNLRLPIAIEEKLLNRITVGY